VLRRIRKLLRRDHAAPVLAGVQLGLVALMSAGLALAAVPKPDGFRLARLTGGDVSQAAFARITAGMDPAMMAIAARFEPKSAPLALRPAVADSNLETVQAVAGAETGVIRLQDLSRTRRAYGTPRSRSPPRRTRRPGPSCCTPTA
jgi:hypothetical protein